MRLLVLRAQQKASLPILSGGEEPTLSGAQEVYSTGDVVSVNCTAPASHPAPNIQFYTNNEKVN
ncbi:hypothetical protein J6590_013652 [Homalodisca vitripennis]|nr:hypothetical protein J6590_013652 [Homalodisca vitripennis]